MRQKLVSVLILVVLMVEASATSRQTEAVMFDRFDNLYCNDEKARLDNYAILVQDQPGAVGYIIFYGGRRYGAKGYTRLPRRNEAEARVSRLKSYLLNSWRNLHSNRIVLVNGGFRETWQADLWIVPNGATPPVPTPTLKPEQIKFRKGIARKRDYLCPV